MIDLLPANPESAVLGWPLAPTSGPCVTSWPVRVRPQLAELLGHGSVILGEIDAATAGHVDQLLIDAGVFDSLAGHVVHVARQRGWPALSADPGRLHRVDPALAVDLL